MSFLKGSNNHNQTKFPEDAWKGKYVAEKNHKMKAGSGCAAISQKELLEMFHEGRAKT